VNEWTVLHAELRDDAPVEARPRRAKKKPAKGAVAEGLS
jgi:hypothetical protein